MREVLGKRFSNGVSSNISSELYTETVYRPTAPEHKKTGLVVSLCIWDGIAKQTIAVYRENTDGRLLPTEDEINQANTRLQGTEYRFQISKEKLHLSWEKLGAFAVTKTELRDLVDSMMRTFYCYMTDFERNCKASIGETRRLLDVEQPADWIYQVARMLKLTDISFICNTYRVKLKSPTPLVVYDKPVFRQTLCLRYSLSTRQFSISIVCNETIPLTQEHLEACKNADIWNHRLAVNHTCSVQSAAELLEATQLLQAEYWLVVMDLAEKALVKCRYIPVFDMLIMQEIRAKGSVNERDARILMAFQAFNTVGETQYSEIMAYPHMLISAAEARITSIWDHFLRLKSALQYQALSVSLLSQQISATSFITPQFDQVRFIDYYRANPLPISELMDYISQLIQAVSSIKSSGCVVTHILKSCYICPHSHQLLLQPVWLGSSFFIAPGEMGCVEDFVFAALKRHSLFINEYISASEIYMSQVVSVLASIEGPKKKIIFTVDNEETQTLPLISTIETLYWTRKAAEFESPSLQSSPPVAIYKERTIASTRFFTPKFGHISSMRILTESPEIRQSCDKLQIFRTLAALLERAHTLGFPHYHLSPSLLTNKEGSLIVSGFRGRLRKMVKTSQSADLREFEYWDHNIVKYLWWLKEDTTSDRVCGKLRKYEQRLDHTVDTYGFAMLIYNSLTDRSPFHYLKIGNSLEDFYMKVVKPGLQPVFPEEFERKHPRICYFLRLSWGRPAVRPAFEDLLGALAKYFESLSS